MMHRPAQAQESKKPVKLTNVWREARDLVHQHRGRLLLGLLLIVVSRGAGIVLPASSKFLIDDVILKEQYELLWPLALVVLGATVLHAVTTFTLAQILGVAAHRVINDMRQQLQEHVTRLPIRYFNNTHTGVLISRIMTDAEGVRNLVGNGLVQFVGGIITAVIALGILLYLNWSMTLIIVGILSVFGVGMVYAFRYMRPIFRERREINAQITGRLAEGLGGIRIVKAYTAEQREQEVFATGIERMFRKIKQSITGASAMESGGVFVIGLVSFIMLVIGGRAVIRGDMTLGDLMAFGFLTGLLGMPITQIASIGTQISEAFAGLDRIREVRQQITEDVDEASREACAEVRGDVRFEDVSFEYETGKPVLRDISFHAPAGTTTALVGSSGAGKSTLVSLIMAFHAPRPRSGVVRVDGRDLTQLKLHDYRGHLGVVLQDDYLFDGTIAENIAFAKPDALRDEIEAAARAAHCEEFIRGFEHGYDQLIGERGVRLSGGQRQRLAIARALLADPRILILDEATSSLDSESEAKIQDALATLRAGRTTFVIAHRLSTIRSADQILVLEHGQIIERGTHEELYAAGGRYRDLHDRQHRIHRELYLNPGEEEEIQAAESEAV